MSERRICERAPLPGNEHVSLGEPSEKKQPIPAVVRHRIYLNSHSGNPDLKPGHKNTPDGIQQRLNFRIKT